RTSSAGRGLLRGVGGAGGFLALTQVLDDRRLCLGCALAVGCELELVVGGRVVVLCSSTDAAPGAAVKLDRVALHVRCPPPGAGLEDAVRRAGAGFAGDPSEADHDISDGSPANPAPA